MNILYHQETESGQTGGAASGATGGAFGGVSTTPLASPSATSMRRQFSVRAPQMASIVEEDLSLGASLCMDIPLKVIIVLDVICHIISETHTITTCQSRWYVDLIFLTCKSTHEKSLLLLP